jgi:hypothetical protein
MNMRNTIASDYLLVWLWLFHAGSFLTIFISAVILKSNNILRKQTSLKVSAHLIVEIFLFN